MTLALPPPAAARDVGARKRKPAAGLQSRAGWKRLVNV